MKLSPILHDFTAGELSPEYYARPETDEFRRGARVFFNMRPKSQGGFTSTGGSWFCADLPTGVGDWRLLPFVISEKVQFLIAFGRNSIRVYTVAADGSLTYQSTLALGITLSDAEIWEVQFCQSYNNLYFTHKSLIPRKITYTAGTFSTSPLAIVTNASEPTPFQLPDERPGCCTFFGGRLYLAGSTAKPQGIWASVPYEPENFTWWETITRDETRITDPATWADPRVVETEVVQVEKDVIGAGSAFHFEIASDCNDTIVSLAPEEELAVNTISSMWIIPRTITATDLDAKLKSRQDSMRVQGRMVHNGKVVTVQRGGLGVWESKNGEDGIKMNAAAAHILAPGVQTFDYTRTPEKIVYFTCSDGHIGGALYVESEKGWGWFTMKQRGASYRTVISISTEAGDYCYVLVIQGGVQWIERLDEEITVNRAEKVTFTAGSGTVSSRLFGQTVQIENQNEAEVTAGPTGAISLGVIDGEQIVGLGFTSVMATLPVNSQTEYGQAVLKRRRVNEAFLHVISGGHFTVGYHEDLPDIESAAEHNCPVTDTGACSAPIRGGYTTDLSIQIRRTRPFKLEIGAIVPELEVSEQ